MKKQFLTIVLICVSSFSFSQLQLETVGNPTFNESVSTYTGWVNQGLLTYEGTAEVRYILPNFPSGGYVFFDSLNSFLEISGYGINRYVDLVNIQFGLMCSDTASPTDLKVEITFDNTNWLSLAYDSIQTPNAGMGYSIYIDTSITISNMHLRFTNTTTSKKFILDNIDFHTAILLANNNIQLSVKRLNPSKVGLHWSTTNTDTQNDIFIIEQSKNGLDFLPFGNKKGTNSGNRTYSYIANEVQNGMSYYRIKDMKKNGTFILSNIAKIGFKAISESLLQKTFPRPANQSLNIELFTPTPIKVEVSIMNLSGQIVLNKKINLLAGNTKSAIDVSQIKPGEYIMKLATDAETTVEKIVIQR